jgi:hypothetical protein
LNSAKYLLQWQIFYFLVPLIFTILSTWGIFISEGTPEEITIYYGWQLQNKEFFKKVTLLIRLVEDADLEILL